MIAARRPGTVAVTLSPNPYRCCCLLLMNLISWKLDKGFLTLWKTNNKEAVEDRITYSGWWIVAIAAVAMSTGPGQFAFGALGLFIKPLGEEFGWDRAPGEPCRHLLYYRARVQHTRHRPVDRSFRQQAGPVTLHPDLRRIAGAACLVGRYPVETVSHLHPDGLPGRRRQCTAIFAHHRDPGSTGGADWQSALPWGVAAWVTPMYRRWCST